MRARNALRSLLTVFCLAGAARADFKPGDLLIANAGGNDVLDFSRSGAFNGVFASGGGLLDPGGLTFGPDGNLYVGGIVNGKLDVVEYNGTTGAFLRIFATDVLAPDLGLTFGPDGKFYVGAIGSSQVNRYDGTTGAFLDHLDPLNHAHLSDPEGMAFGRDGDLYVASSNGNQILRYDVKTGAFLDIFVTTKDSGGLRTPTGIAFGSDGNLYVASQGTNQVLRYDGATGAFLDIFAATNLSRPEGLGFGTDGDLYVTNQGSNSVTRYDGSTGAFLDTYASGNGLSLPSGLGFIPHPGAVPEPAGWLLTATGLALLIGVSRRRLRPRTA